MNINELYYSYFQFSIDYHPTSLIVQIIIYILEQFPLYCLNLATSNALFSYIHTNTLNKDNILKSYYYKASIFKYITSFIVDTKPSSSFWNRRFIIFIIAFTFIFVFILFLLCKDKTVKLISLMKWIHQ